MEHHTTTTRAEAERLLGIAEKLLRSKDFAGCREFAVLAQETEPLLDGCEQILAVADVLLASDKRIGQQNDWYSILQITQRTDDPEVIKRHYRKLALLLHPDKNKFPFADNAFRLVADAWNVLSDSSRKFNFDNDFSVFKKVDIVLQKDLPQQQPQSSPTTQPDRNQTDSSQKLPVRRSNRAQNTSGTRGSGAASGSGKSSTLGSSARGARPISKATFWTVCPYCYNLYEYVRVYKGCCLKCQICERAFTGMELIVKPPTVPGKDAYYCCWGFFPMGFVNGKLDAGGSGGKGAAAGSGFPNWMPPMFPAGVEQNNSNVSERRGPVNVTPVSPPVKPVKKKVTTPAAPGSRKRGRPRKNPL